jgi:RND family efflux transporter MFP subunit
MRLLPCIAFAYGTLSGAAALAQQARMPDTPPIGVQIVSRETAPLAAPMSGQVVSFSVKDGDRVEGGTVLVRFNCAQQEAMHLRTQAELAKREDILATQSRLKALRAYSKAEFSQAQNDVAVAKAEVAVAQTALDNCKVTAPFDGRVAAVSVRNFQFVQAGAPLLDLVDDRNLELEMVVSSMLLSGLEPGSAVRIRVAETQRDYDARITRISGRVDAASQTIKVYGVIVGDAQELLPGMSGVARFPSATR